MVALVDALGFRGIWQRHRSESVFADIFGSLHRVLVTVDMGTHRNFFLREDIDVRMTAFSDTILLVAESRNPSKEEGIAEALDYTMGLLAKLVWTAARGTPPLAYRGCVAVGQLAISGSSYLGEAIDEAAEWYEQPDAAVVVLAPSARRCAERFANAVDLLEMPIPFKSGGALRVQLINPLWPSGLTFHVGENVPALLDNAIASLLSPFETNTTVAVERKRQNTQAVLRAAKEQTLKAYAKMLDEEGKVKAVPPAEVPVDWT